MVWIKPRVSSIRIVHLVGAIGLTAVSVSAQQDVCAQYQTGNLITKEVVVFLGLEDIGRIPPEVMQPITYREEYRTKPRAVGAPGFPYETVLGFRINIDTGDPTPRYDAEYDRNHLHNRDFELLFDSTWSEPEDLIPAYAALPVEGTVGANDYTVIGERHGMTEVTYLPAFQRTNAGEYAIRRSNNTDTFLTTRDGTIETIMICGNSSVVNHCSHYQIIDGFRVETWFKRNLLPDLDTILTRAGDFTRCMLKGN